MMRQDGDGELPEAWLTDGLRFASARLASREDAEDAVAEAWAQAHRQRRRVLAATEPRIYFLGIVRQRAARKARRRKAAEPGPFVVGPFDTATAERMDLACALGALPEDQREAVVLKHVLGCSLEEIGQLQGRSPEAVSSLLQRARARLKAELTPHHEETP
jgi:RNA polymerase sigma-70 factor (ECF subfamily)